MSRRTVLLGAAAVLAGSCTSEGTASVANEREVSSNRSSEPPPSSSTDSAAVQDSAAVAPADTPITVEMLSAPADPGLSGYPFTLGVASGDPLDDRVILWTRVAPNPLGDNGGVSFPTVDLVCDIATDVEFTDLVASRSMTAPADEFHTVHFDADGLAPLTDYFYRFRVGDHVSPVGRTKTSGPTDQLRLAVASCQNFEHGLFGAHRHLADEIPDVVLFCGDYIYDVAWGEGVRTHDRPTVSNLADYRARYSQYRLDPDLQKSHASAPWIITWDDHEVENNYAGQHPNQEAAYRAWWEHQPVRLPRPTGPALKVHRSFRWGDFANIIVLDGRQYRTTQPCGDGLVSICPEIETGTMLGAEQEAWAIAELAVPTTWSILVNQTVMADLTVEFAGSSFLNADQWDGYAATRRALFDAMASSPNSNPLVFTGDIHAMVVATLAERQTPEQQVGTEFVSPSITSRFPQDRADLVELGLSLVSNVAGADPSFNGYLVADLTPASGLVRYRAVSDVADPQATIATHSTWAFDPDTPGVAET